jgi:nicotinate-nucleotide adenylyltransferase
MAMCRLAVERLAPDVEVLDMEARRQGASYTIDTLRALQAQRPGHQWRLMIGTDILDQTALWKDWEQIERLAPPLVIPRLTADSDLEQASRDLRRISSTHLRDSLAQGRCPHGVLARSVLRYISENHLYDAETKPQRDA